MRDKGETLVLKSKLSIKEIEANFKGVDFFAGFMAGLDEALAYEKGDARAATVMSAEDTASKVNEIALLYGLSVDEASAMAGKIRFKGEDGDERQV